ncbi:hypothetical protein VPG91_11360 [Nitrospirillum amazonense]|uniref:hypothetical protein n=1 Tax=Nitrospirillum amazonense TaxID=28077 RepID=UPI002DD422A8|nr:hypothetical protein [Nitrospirillum amazonense]MEC4591586.1 hypothetical protein [Nitrospirillum amazonense]
MSIYWDDNRRDAASAVAAVMLGAVLLAGVWWVVRRAVAGLPLLPAWAFWSGLAVFGTLLVLVIWQGLTTGGIGRVPGPDTSN